MFCRYCGEEIEDDSVFCTKCGKRLVDQNSEAISNNTPKTVPLPIEEEEVYEEIIEENPRSYHYALKIGLIIGMCIFVVLMGFPALLDMSDNAQITTDKGTVYITSNPSGATVKFGGEYRGVTPLELTITADTNYALYLTKDGYDMWYQSVSVSPGEYKTISANMKSRYAQPTYTQTPTPTPTYTQTNTQTYSSSEYYTRDYTWMYNGREYSMTMYLPRATYSYYKNLGHSNSNLAKYATDTNNRKSAKSVADAIREFGDKHGYSGSEEVMMAVAFVQALPYTSDSVTTGHDEYVRYPIETLVDYVGDCEDTAILTAAILREMGYGVVLLKLPGHVAVGVKGGDGVYGAYWIYNGEKYFYLETTGRNWDIGEIPNEYKNSKATVIYVA